MTSTKISSVEQASSAGAVPERVEHEVEAEDGQSQEWRDKTGASRGERGYQPTNTMRAMAERKCSKGGVHKSPS